MTHPKKRCDCPEAKWPKCGHPWWLIMRHLGTAWAVSLDKHCKLYEPTRGRPATRGDAELLAGEIATAIRKGAYPPTAVVGPTVPRVATGVTFQAAADAFVVAVITPSDRDRETKANYTSRFARYARTVVPGWGPLGTAPLRALTTATLEAVYRHATKGMSNSTKQKYRQTLRALLDWAVATGALTQSPLPKEADLPAGECLMRTRRVYPEEEARLLQAAALAQQDACTRLVAMLVLALDLGARIGELLALRWCDVLWDEGPLGRIRFAALERRARKSGLGKARRVPMTERVQVLLAYLRQGPTGHDWPGSAYVLGTAIGGRVTSVRNAWVVTVFRAHDHEPAWVDANVPTPESLAIFKGINLHIHDLRHECALRWLKSGLTLGAIAHLLGHHDLQTLRVYLGLAEADALRELEGGVVEGEGPAGPQPFTLRRHDGTMVHVDVARDGLQTRTNRVQTGPARRFRVVKAKTSKAS